MKLFCVIANGQDVLRAAAGRAPNLIRHEGCGGEGGGTLVFCAVPPPDTTADRLVEAFERRIAPRLAGAGPARVILTLTWFAILGPRFGSIRRSVCTWPRRQYRKWRFRLGPGRSLKGSRVYLDTRRFR